MAGLLARPGPAGAQPPQPPCGGAQPWPPYAAVDAQPNLQVWRSGALAGWRPPGCTGWQPHGTRGVIALAGSFRQGGGVASLLARIGAVSALRGLRYWSVTDQAWRTLILDATALDGPDPGRRRPDFSAAEVASGRDLYFVQETSRPAGAVLYRMRLVALAEDRIAVAAENVSPVRALLFTLHGPGELESLHMFERLGPEVGQGVGPEVGQGVGPGAGPEVWGYYGLLRAAFGSRLLGGLEPSYANRAVALFRHFAAIPPDRTPPAP